MLQRPSLPHTPGPQTPASPPHNPYPHVLPLKPRKSPPPSPCRTQAVTSASPLRHAQVRWHHPVTVRKTRRDTASTPSQHGVQARLRRQPAPRKPRHGATPMRRASPATALTRRTRAPPRRASPTTTPTRRAKTSPPQHSAQVPPRQPVAHEPRRDATHHGATQKPRHQPAATPPCAPSPPLLTSYSSTS